MAGYRTAYAIEYIERGGLTFEVARRSVKRLNMRVTPDGRIRVSVPSGASRGVILDFLDAHVGWAAAALARAARTAAQSRCLPNWLEDGQLLWLAGRAVRLRLRLDSARPVCTLRLYGSAGSVGAPGAMGAMGAIGAIEAIETPGAPGATDGAAPVGLQPVLLVCGPDEARARQCVKRWLRGDLSHRLPGLFEPLIRQTGLEPAEIRIRDMRTRWGSCNTRERRIWMSLQLAGYPDELVSYVALHELVHLAEPSHNRRFWALVSRYMPDWSSRRQLLRFPDGPD